MLFLEDMLFLEAFEQTLPADDGRGDEVARGMDEDLRLPAVGGDLGSGETILELCARDKFDLDRSIENSLGLGG
jgi:hypothetical protein